MPLVDLDPTVERSWNAIRDYWKVVRGPCRRCGGPIAYDVPRYRYIWLKDGTRVRRENRWALDVGHILGQDIDQRKRWAPIDTAPEHARCNRAAGARYKNAKWGDIRRTIIRVRTSRNW